MTTRVVSWRAIGLWTGLLCVLVIPILAAAQSPLLAWRGPVYVAAGFAGVVAFALLALQPLLAAGLLPGVPPRPGRRVHRWTGLAIVAAIIVHVGGLWITSPPDVVDALLFVSATPFSIWGVLAMWAIFATAVLAAFWRRARLQPRVWRRAHVSLGLLIVAGTVLHVVLIEGTMETVSKLVLCAVALAVTLPVVVARWR